MQASIRPTAHHLLIGIALAVCTLAPASADDTEIFFGQAGGAFENNPNVLFVLDNSGSMGASDAGLPGSRMTRMKNAMRLLLDQSSSYNVGMAAFQGAQGGAAIRYPIGYLESDSGSLCEGGVCPDETIVARPSSIADDAVQNDDTNEVVVDAPRLTLADAGTVSTAAPDGTQVDGFALATGDMWEAIASDDPGESEAKRDIDKLTWFYHTDDHEPMRLAFRFEDIRIPRDAIVTSARIDFIRTDASDQRGTVSARIAAEAKAVPTRYQVDNAPLIERNATQNRTNAVVSWNDIPVSGAAAEPRTIASPDIGAILTEVVGLNGWASGNPVSILVNAADDYLASDRDIRELWGADAPKNDRPVLRYTYTERSGSDPDQGRLQASAHSDEYRENNTDVAWGNTGAELSKLFHVDGASQPRRLALRFDGVAIPRGATIRSARLILQPAPTDAPDPDAADWTREPGAKPPESDPEPESGATTGDPVDPVDLGAAGESGVSLTIKAERSDAPAPYAEQTLGAREHTSRVSAWDDLPSGSAAALESPDLSGVIEEVIALPDWDAGDALSLLLSPAADYTDRADNLRRVLTSASSSPPRLNIDWEATPGGGATATGTQTTAIRFSRVHVPPGARIKSARLVFTAAGSDDEPTELTISAQAEGSPVAFTTRLNDIGARPRTDARETWSAEPWEVVGLEYATPDLSRVIDEVVNRSDWCGGNPMVLFVRGTGRRQAEAFRDGGSASPRLDITYEPGSIAGDSYCSNSSLDIALPDVHDDAVQDLITGVQQANGATSSTRSGEGEEGHAQSIGIRFQDVQIPRGTRIINAALRLATREPITTAAQLEVRVESVDDARAFRATEARIESRDWSTDVADWHSLGPADAGDPIVSDDITSLVAATVARPGWRAGNAIAFRLNATGGTTRHFVSRDSDEAAAPTLLIYFESVRDDPGTRFRDNLQREVERLRPQGATPITSALSEAVNYYRGAPVDYGRRRGDQSPWTSTHLRLSHPYSHEGGTQSRSERCAASGPDDASCAHETLLGSPRYRTPMQSQCQSHHIVLLSDGSATSDDRAADSVSPVVGGCDRSHANASEHCGRELARWMAATDHDPDTDGQQTLNLHTIAFALNGDDAFERAATEFLADLAREGGGGHYAATSSEQLLSALQDIFINVASTDANFVAPTVTLSNQNRLKNRDDVYFSLFKPEPTARWGGNLKRYRSRGTPGTTDEIVDVDGNPAIDAATGLFYPGARSWWSATADGGSVLLGGAAAQLENNGQSNAARRIATFTGLEEGGSRALMSDSNRLAADNARLDPSWFDLPPSHAARPGYLERLIGWTRGQDVLDIDADGDTTESRPEMGDSLHAQPVVLNYADGRSVVYTATNAGLVHATDSATGSEHWSFIPKELLKNAHKRFQNVATRQRPYGLDGGLTTWVDDTDGDGKIDVDEKAYLYIGMRRGGSDYYALDVSSISAPAYRWRIAGGAEVIADGDPTTADGDWEELGQSWSQPVKTRVIDGEQELDVLIFAGGYDTNQDPPMLDDPDAAPASTRAVDGVGRAVFIADALTGRQLWRTDAGFTGMDYGIPSTVKVIDIDFDGVADMLFVGDMGGQLWRLDLNNDRSTDTTLSRRITGGRIALLAGDGIGEDRRFYYPPSVSLISVAGSQQLAIAIGSGWRAHPLDTLTQDRLYSIRSTHVYGPPLDTTGVITYPSVADDANGAPTTGFANVTATLNPADTAIRKGWWIDLGTDAGGGEAAPGEKVLNAAVAADGRLLLTSYRPETDVAACTPAVGSSAVWALDSVNGSPTDAFTDGGAPPGLADRAERLDQPGLSGPVSIRFPETGEATFSVGTEKIDQLGIEELRRRTFWQELLE